MSSFHEWRPDFNLAPAKTAAIIIGLVHVIALVAVIWLPMALVIYLLLGASLAMSLFISLVSLGYCRGMLTTEVPLVRWAFRRLFRLLARRSVCALVLQHEPLSSEPWQLLFADGHQAAYELLGSSVVSRHAVCLSFTSQRRRLVLPIPVLITADRISEDDYRQLQVWLRWQSNSALGLGVGSVDD